MPSDNHTNSAIEQAPSYPSWVEQLHRFRWLILLVVLFPAGFIGDSSNWLRPIIFFSSIVGFWIKDLVDWISRKRADRAG